MSTTLEKTASTVSPSDFARFFRGVRLPANRTGPFYWSGLVVVTIAMVLLPVLYCALIVLAGLAVYYHAVYNAVIWSGSGGWQVKFILYFGPLAAGLAVVFFMVKPLLASPARPPANVTLDPQEEPGLFAFVRHLAAAVGAPNPKRIDVDCEVNASASFRKGIVSFLGNDLVLTIGLPLAAGLDVSQLAGILAHELGHFRQGVGMRLTYIIRTVNHWFYRVVYERDEWDEWLSDASRNSDWRLRILLLVCRGSVWLSRKILLGLMIVGNAISCFMMRQMEYDADSYEIKVAGSHGFTRTAYRLEELSVSSHVAHSGLSRCWADRRLPADLPLYVLGHEIKEETRQALQESCGKSKTGLFDTHPAFGDRIRAAEKAACSPLIDDQTPARGLFLDFGAVSKKVTEHQYRVNFGLNISQENLIETAQLLAENQAESDSQERLRSFFRGTASVARPLTVGPDDLVRFETAEDALGAFCAARKRMKDEHPNIEEVFVRFDNADTKLIGSQCAAALLKAAIPVDAAAFGLEEATPEHARQAEETATVERQECLPALAAFDDDVRACLIAAVALLDLAIRPEESPGNEARQLVQVLAAFRGVHEPFLDLRKDQAILHQLFSNGRDTRSEERFGKCVIDTSDRLDAHIRRIQEGLDKTAYPFPHSGDPMTLAHYCRSGMPLASNQIEGIYNDSGHHLDKLSDVYFRVLARLVAIAERVEAPVEQNKEAAH